MKTTFLVQQIAADLLTLNSTAYFIPAAKILVTEGQTDTVIKELYQQSQDNRPLVSKLIGENLLIKIESVCCTV